MKVQKNLFLFLIWIHQIISKQKKKYLEINVFFFSLRYNSDSKRSNKHHENRAKSSDEDE